MIALAALTLAHGAEWRLAAAYDAAAVASLSPATPTWVWGEGATGMAASCGRAKSPDGLGIFEAEAVASGLTPALVLLLERTGGEGGLSTEDVRVAIEDEGAHVLLQPMVEPRHLAITISATPETSRFAQLVRTQLEVETCLEHKTGRGWTGHDVTRVRQAFLLERPLGDERSRKFFGGELDPVPALSGPPDACFVDGAREVAEPAADTSLWLVPTDIWGASLRACGPDERPGIPVGGASALPLTLTGGGASRPTAAWTPLEIELSLPEGTGDDEKRVQVTVRWDGRTLVDHEPLFATDEGASGLMDILARVPHRYPVIEGRYVALVVPEWQAIEALRRLEGGDHEGGMTTPPVGVTDAIGALLAAPERLSVQVRPDLGAQPTAQTSDGAGNIWPNLAGVLLGPARQPFGYTVGLTGGQAPLALPSEAPPDWLQTARGQRAFEQSALTASLVVLLVGVIAGLRRVRDLWTTIPHERAHYWPGLGESTKVPHPGLDGPPTGGAE